MMMILLTLLFNVDKNGKGDARVDELPFGTHDRLMGRTVARDSRLETRR